MNTTEHDRYYVRQALLECYFEQSNVSVKTANITPTASDNKQFLKSGNNPIHAVETRAKGTSKVLCSSEHFVNKKIIDSVNELSQEQIGWVEACYAGRAENLRPLLQSVSKLDDFKSVRNKEKLNKMIMFCVVNTTSEINQLNAKIPLKTIAKNIGMTEQDFSRRWKKHYVTVENHLHSVDKGIIDELHKKQSTRNKRVKNILYSS